MEARGAVGNIRRPFNRPSAPPARDSFGRGRVVSPVSGRQPQRPQPQEPEVEVEETEDETESHKIVTESADAAETLQDYPNFIQSISEFFNQEALSDVSLKVGEDFYPAHKFVLAKSSDVFRTMLYDKNWMKQGNPEMELNESDECRVVFSIFLRYLYTAEVNICTDTAVGIICLADKYNVTSLKTLCTKYMTEHSKSPRVGNALQWYAWSKALHLPTLFDRCFQCICWNLYDIITSDDWLSMDVDFVNDILQSDKLVIPDEFTLFEYVLSWLVLPSRQSSLRENADTLLRLIRFPQMLVTQLNKIEHHEIAETPECQELIKELIGKAYRFRALCPSQQELGLSFKETFFQPRDYCYQIVDTIRMASSLRFGIQVDVKMFVGPVPREDRNGDWKITYRKNGDVWSLQIYCHESAMIQTEARFQAAVMISDEDEKVIQVQRANEFVCSRGNHQNIQITIDDPAHARIMSVIIKPTAN